MHKLNYTNPFHFHNNSFNFLFIVLLLASNLTSLAEEITITDSNAIRCIVGEGANQGYHGMIAIGNVIRTRKNLNGFYGFKNPSVNKQPKWVWTQASRAWAESKTNNLVGGATHFENVEAFGLPKWAKGMTKTVKIKDHTFFKQ